MMKIKSILSTTIAFGLVLFSAGALAGEQLDPQTANNEEFNKIVNELIDSANKGNLDEVKGLGSKLCRFKCDRVYDVEKAACGPGANTGPVKECRDNAARHRDTCKRGC